MFKISLSQTFCILDSQMPEKKICLEVHKRVANEADAQANCTNIDANGCDISEKKQIMETMKSEPEL